MSHTPPPKHLDLKFALQEERHALEQARVPIITVSATFRKELMEKYSTTSPSNQEAVFSRAHYSMAEAVRQQALKQKFTSHLADPTNFVSLDNTSKVEFTQFMGQLMARNKPLKWLKDKIDTIARSKLPITQAITDPLIYLVERVYQPIISLHYEAGNIVAACDKRILQVLTDPHVRPQYLDPLPLKTATDSKPPNITFTVFDQETKKQMLHMAHQLHKQLDPQSVHVAGPPVDPRITRLYKKPRTISKNTPVNVAITTGGLGTNLDEIKQVLESFKPLLKPPAKIKLFLNASTHDDHRDFYESFAREQSLRIGNLDDTSATVRILYEDSIVDANENLIRYMFPWAHVVITKPSGDMAYDIAAAGAAALFLEPWGEWEQNIQSRFVRLGAAHDLNVKKAHNHFSYLLTTGALKKSISKAKNLPVLFRSGTKNIISLQQKLAK